MLSYLRGAFAFIFVIFPLVEIAVLIKVGAAIGFWPTMLLLIAAALLGFTVIREQGLTVVARAFDTLREGRIPLEPMLDSYVVIMAGLLLLIAPLRRWCIRRVVGYIYDHPLIAGRNPRVEKDRGPVIDATYERNDPDP